MTERIRLSRAKGWRKPEGAIVVARPSRYGNPFRIVAERRPPWDLLSPLWLYRASNGTYDSPRGTKAQAAAHGVALWRFHADLDDLDLRRLRGHDLACWCPLDQPCHADVLLEWANR